MPYMRLVALIILFCGQLNSQNEITISAKLEKEDIHIGEPVSLYIRYENHTKKKLILGSSHFRPSMKIDIVNQKSNDTTSCFKRLTHHRTGLTSFIYLEPGICITDTFRLWRYKLPEKEGQYLLVVTQDGGAPLLNILPFHFEQQFVVSQQTKLDREVTISVINRKAKQELKGNGSYWTDKATYYEANDDLVLMKDIVSRYLKRGHGSTAAAGAIRKLKSECTSKESLQVAKSIVLKYREPIERELKHNQPSQLDRQEYMVWANENFQYMVNETFIIAAKEIIKCNKAKVLSEEIEYDEYRLIRRIAEE